MEKKLDSLLNVRSELIDILNKADTVELIGFGTLIGSNSVDIVITHNNESYNLNITQEEGADGK